MREANATTKPQMSGTIIEIRSLFILCIKTSSQSIHCEYRMIIDEIGKLEQELIRI